MVTEQRLETTLYSLDEAVPTPDQAERRGDERLLTLFRVGVIKLGDRRELCLIKNISAGGMMIRAFCDFEEGDALSVELKTGEPIPGRATWVKGRNVGVTFDVRIDIIDILCHSHEALRPRMPRIEINCPVTLYVDGRPHRATCLDISQGGVKLETRDTLPRDGRDIGVALPGRAPIRASACWQDGDLAGVTFNTLMPLDDLVSWLHGQRGPVKKAG